MFFLPKEGEGYTEGCVTYTCTRFSSKKYVVSTCNNPLDLFFCRLGKRVMSLVPNVVNNNKPTTITVLRCKLYRLFVWSPGTKISNPNHKVGACCEVKARALFPAGRVIKDSVDLGIPDPVNFLIPEISENLIQ